MRLALGSCPCVIEASNDSLYLGQVHESSR